MKRRNDRASFRPGLATIPPTGEIEVARVCYPDTTLSDVVSVLAKREGSGLTYRVVTDNDEVLATLRPCPLPLTTAQLIRLMHRAKQARSCWRYLVRECGVKPKDLPRYQIFSDHYPGLNAYYAERCGTAQHEPKARLESVRKGLLANLLWEERAKGFQRTKRERDKAVRRFLSLRFTS